MTGTKSEREIKLEEENERLKGTVKERETEVATVKDEFHRYKKTVETTPAPKDPPKKSSRLLSFMEE